MIGLRKLVRMCAALFVIAVLVYLPFYLQRKIIIRELICESQFGVCSQRILDDLQGGKNLNYYEAKTYLGDILDENPLVKNYLIQFNLPGKLKIEITENKPVFALIDESGETAVLDRDGKVLYITDSTTLSSLVVNGDLPQKGEQVDERILFASKIVYDIYNQYHKKTGRIEDDTLVIELDPEIKVLFPLEGDRELLVGSLNLLVNRLKSILSQTTIEGIAEISGKTLDLRFKNPVIR